METSILFRSGDLVLEGLLHRCEGNKGVIITHPHPLYGGAMDNVVVDALAAAFKNKGYSTLRFNFRGVGNSTGSHDNGVGERDDVLAAIGFFIDSGIHEIVLAGYSYGAYVIASLKELPQQVDWQLHVAPPVAFMDYSQVSAIPKLHSVIAGEYDDIAPPGQIQQLLPLWNKEAKLTVLPGCDHFFSSGLDALSETVSDLP